MAIEGNLRDLSLVSLVQLACTEQLQAHLRVRHDGREAHIYFEDGEIVHMSLGDQEGKEVIYELLTWEEGTFALEKGVPPPRRTVTDSWSGLLLEGMRRLDEAQSENWADLLDTDEVGEDELLAELTAIAPEVAEQIIQEMREKKEETEMAVRKRRSALLAETLADLVSGSTDIEGGALVGIDGLVISANVPMGNLDETMVGAAAATISGLSKRSVDQLKRGDFEQTLIKGSNGYIIVTPVDERSVFVGLTPANVNLGMVFVETREVTAELRNIMS